jgi:hypothetical protein
MRKLHPESQKIVDETFALYKEGGICPSTLKGKTIIHLYPKKDTMEPDGTLNGYYQNLFFEMVIFNISGSNKTMYRFSGLKDAIFTEKVNITNLSVFKDGAFCVTVDGEIHFLDGQAPTLCKS